MSRGPVKRNLLDRVKRTQAQGRGIGNVKAREWRAFDLTGVSGDDAFSPPGFHRSGGYVYLRGVLTGGSGGAVFATLPEGYRPEYPLRLPTVASGGNAARINVSTDGDLSANGTDIATWVTLDGLSFRAHA